MVNLNFQQPLLQSSVSHDPSQINVICWFKKKYFIIIIIILEDIFAA